ncbi:hypothetical protein DID88_001237 [Monilinia fructigena]|uniref:Protein arginine N-methyltransferase domain-containing protein n=1 Tax=Monilinia fructigena TaxID=38457 RepID=A0A395IY96_9HELO|nr:hypothetical protein DID88_001237 [Monilinia fructigena]
MADDPMKGLEHSEAHYFNSYNHHGMQKNSNHVLEKLLINFICKGIHEEMLKDEVRTRSYMNAIVQNKHLFKDKIVLDGMWLVPNTSSVSICPPSSRKAREIVAVNGMSDKITLLQGKMEEVELPFPKVDIIISEWMGYFLLYESMLDTVLYARDKYLAPNGLIFPDKATIFMAGIEDGEYKDEKIGFWDNVYGFDYSPLKATALTETSHLAFSSPFKLDVRRDDFIHALIAWFDIDFTACHKPIRFSTGPHTKYTHWKQTVFYLKEVLTVQQGEQIVGQLDNKPNEKNPRDLDVKIQYKLETSDPLRQAEGGAEYKMC